MEEWHERRIPVGGASAPARCERFQDRILLPSGRGGGALLFSLWAHCRRCFDAGAIPRRLDGGGERRPDPDSLDSRARACGRDKLLLHVAPARNAIADGRVPVSPGLPLMAAR